MSRGKYRRRRERQARAASGGRGRFQAFKSGELVLTMDPASGPDASALVVGKMREDGVFQVLGVRQGPALSEAMFLALIQELPRHYADRPFKIGEEVELPVRFKAPPPEPVRIEWRAPMDPRPRKDHYWAADVAEACIRRNLPLVDVADLHRRLTETLPDRPLELGDLSASQLAALETAAALLGGAMGEHRTAGGVLRVINMLRERWRPRPFPSPEDLRAVFSHRERCMPSRLLAAYDRPLTAEEAAAATSGGPMPPGAIAGLSAERLIIDEGLELETPPADWEPGRPWMLEAIKRSEAEVMEAAGVPRAMLEPPPAEVLEEEAIIRDLHATVRIVDELVEGVGPVPAPLTEEDVAGWIASELRRWPE